jgi:HNH endonuclease
MNLTREINLSSGKVAIVDAADYSWLMKWKWCFDGHYAVRWKSQKGKKTKIYMHRVIAKASAGQEVDHINRDGLCNTRFNLRACTRGENARNQSLRPDNTTGYKRVSFNKISGLYKACIDYEGESIHLGYFTDLHNAAHVANEAALKYHGEFAILHELPDGFVPDPTSRRDYKPNATGFKGIYLDMTRKTPKFCPCLSINDRTVHFGRFEIVEDAIIARFKAVLKYRGEAKAMSYLKSLKNLDKDQIKYIYKQVGVSEISTS